MAIASGAVPMALEALAGRARIGAMNIDECPETRRRLGLRDIPTIKLYKDGVEVRDLSRVKDPAELGRAIEEAV